MPNIVGIGNSQVPTNAMLGGLAYQDPAHANLTNVEIENIAKIKANMIPTGRDGAATTVGDVFVYDTRNDSDGGAWRKRTQHCTWYNEPLGTDWRGHRREFPAVAVLVTHEGDNFFGFTIYDGDDPNMSMWLRWHFPMYTPSSNWGSGVAHIGRANFVGYTVGEIRALNGQIAIANKATSTGTWQPGWMINMISEYCIDVVSYGSAANQTYWMSSDISARQYWHNKATTNSYRGSRYGSGDDYNSEGKSQINGKPAKGIVRTISMCIEPDAIIDFNTGLPIPTQAWGRDDGLSVLRGTAQPSAWVNDDWGSYEVWATDFKSNGDLVAVNRNNNVVGTVLWPRSGGYAAEDTGAGNYYHYNLSMALNPSLGVVHSEKEDVRFMLNPHGGEDDLAVIPSSNRGLNLYMGNGNDHSSHASCDRICARITDKYNTGWMMGDCQVAVLMSTNTGAPTQQIHVDESFDATGSWSLADNASISGGSLHLDNTSSSRATHNTFLVAGTKYMCRYHVSNNVNNWQFDDDGSGAGQGSTTVYQDITHGDDGTHTFVFQATGSTRLRLMRTATGNSADISISYIRFHKLQVDEIEYDNDRNITYGGGSQFGLAAIGTGLVRKSVSTMSSSTNKDGGLSELMGYSGWSASNWMVHGYHSKFDIGTNDFLAMGWVYPPPGQTGSHPIIGIGDGDHNDGFLIVLEGGSAWWIDVGYLGVSNSFASSNGGTAVRSAVSGDQWNMFAVYKKSNNFRVYINGEFVGDTWGASSQNWTTKWKAQHMMIGGRAGNLGGATSAWAHSSMGLSMIRFGETYNDWKDSDFWRVYEDERKLFGHGVKCTLEGSSMDLRCMDYDKSTGILHVGSVTSRSDFRRLVRINSHNQTTTNISASGGLVVEYE